MSLRGRTAEKNFELGWLHTVTTLVKKKEKEWGFPPQFFKGLEVGKAKRWERSKSLGCANCKYSVVSQTLVKRKRGGGINLERMLFGMYT